MSQAGSGATTCDPSPAPIGASTTIWATASSGRLQVTLRDGSEAEIGPAEVFEIPAGHDARVIGDEPWIAIDFRGARSYARPVSASTDRILGTILFTDIVGSTDQLRRDGRHRLA